MTSGLFVLARLVDPILLIWKTESTPAAAAVVFLIEMRAGNPGIHFSSGAALCRVLDRPSTDRARFLPVVDSVRHNPHAKEPDP